MKNLFTILSGIILSSIAYSQPVIGTSWLPVNGSKVAQVRADSVGITEGNAGINQTWDFSGLKALDTVVSRSTYILPDGIPIKFKQKFSEANLATFLETQGDSVYNFYQATANDFISLGYCYSQGANLTTFKYDNPLTDMHVPTTFNTTFSDSFSLTNIEMSYQEYYRGFVYTNADAYGTLIMQGKTFTDVIRTSGIMTVTDSVNYSGTDYVTNTRNIVYRWFSASHPAEALLTLVYQKQYNSTYEIYSKMVYYAKLSPSSGLDKLDSQSKIRIYPNPMSLEAIIDCSELAYNPEEFIVCDVTGKVVFFKKFDANSKVLTFEKGDLAAGVYSIIVKGSDANSYFNKLLID